ncbi:hypothetical protein SKAU_G00391860 [Synaphobranchus kaupii]|uniref:Ameloblastin n=1 Tax=Synaphobranchus kaupii TaxID=118154 RepID=A0A9Q1EBQ7_SYNKA|nr:hypothetical protein SKAU_G00391860 [Synaphobranchus kaupii]
MSQAGGAGQSSYSKRFSRLAASAEGQRLSTSLCFWVSIIWTRGFLKDTELISRTLSGLHICPIIRWEMRTAVIFMCLVATACGGPVHRQPIHLHLQQAQEHQQRPPFENFPNREALQELARVRMILEQYAKVFPTMNVPAIQPQNPMLNIPWPVLPSGTPLVTPPQAVPTAAENPQVALSRPDQQVVPEAVSAQPGLIGDPPVQPMTQAPDPGAEAAQPNEQQPQGGPPFLMPGQPNTWAPQPGVPFLLPLPPNTQGTQPAEQPGLPAQMPQVFPSYGFLPFFPSQTNQQFPGYGMPLFFPSGYPQLPVQPAEADQTVQPSLPVQPIQPEQPLQPIVPGQQQIPQIFYMIRQPMIGPFGSASSEELQATGGMGGIGMFLPGFGSGVSAPGVSAAVPGGLPAGQGVAPGGKADPAVPEAPSTSGGPVTSPALPARLDTPLTDAAAGPNGGKPADQSNLPQPSLSTRSQPAGSLLPAMSAPPSSPNALPVPGGEADLYP